MKTKTPFRFVSLLLLTLFVGLLVPTRAQAQTYRLFTLPNVYTSVTAGINTNNLGFDNANGGPNNTALKLPRKLSDGFTFQASFSCPTVTLALVSFVLQGSADGTNFHTVPGSTLVASVAASAASANPTNVVYFTNFPSSAAIGYNYVRLAGITNGNAADITSITTQIGYWE